MRHISLSLYLDFPSSTIHATTLLGLETPHTGPFSLYTRSLTIHSMIDPKIKVTKLAITLSNQSSFLISYSTSPSSSALQWFLPPQTLNKSSPFVYTQCQAIHARSIFPSQDTPAIRIHYSALLNIPSNLSAHHLTRRSPTFHDSDIPHWCSKDRVVEEFVMEQSIPPYLFAFAVGDLDNKEVGLKTRVYTENASSLLDFTASEFGGTEDMIREGEKLFGAYKWERFDLLVLPPSFPYGGMENSRMVFLTPTVIKGDATSAQVVSHELAHSWTGNLIT